MKKRARAISTLLVLTAVTPCLGGDLPVDPRDAMTRVPASDFVRNNETGRDAQFCADWNPDYSFIGSLCCGRPDWKYRRRGIRCTPHRSKNSYCDEMTTEQVRYRELAQAGKLGDLLEYLQKDGLRRIQAYCSYNDGFLAWGRPIIPTSANGLLLRNDHRCVHFGTDPLVMMMEWVGRSAKAQGLEGVLIGDVSAPRGGCLSGHGGRKGHASHTTGRDADVGFVGKNGALLDRFTRKFDVESNYKLLKSFFLNPFACVRVVFLDHRHIFKLGEYARKIGDQDFERIRPFVRHVRNHRDHFHIRIGDRPGVPGCNETLDTEPEIAMGNYNFE